MRHAGRVEIDRRSIGCDRDPRQPHHPPHVFLRHGVKDAADVAAFFRHQIDAGVHRIGIAAQAVGIAQEAFEAAVTYSKARKAFGRPIADFQVLRFYLADMATDVDAARLLTRKAAAAKESITWPCFFDGGGTGGPIATKWGVRGWPTIFVLDAEGVIRFKNVRGEEMDRAVDGLLKEMKEAK